MTVLYIFILYFRGGG